MTGAREQARACRALWAEVMLLAVTDAWHDPRDGWPGSRNFFAVAALAGLEHGAAVQLAARIRVRQSMLDAGGARPRVKRAAPVGILAGVA